MVFAMAVELLAPKDDVNAEKAALTCSHTITVASLGHISVTQQGIKLHNIEMMSQQDMM